MLSLKLAFAVAVSVTAVRAQLAVAVSDDNCQNFIGDCFQNGCSGVFANPSDTIGTCTAGTFNGCPCEKCGSGKGFIGACGDNGCEGVEGTCTAGQFQGCPCV
ncbi:hypothetical protein Hte_008889 [Hypoxylon texense]